MCTHTCIYIYTHNIYIYREREREILYIHIPSHVPIRAVGLGSFSDATMPSALDVIKASGVSASHGVVVLL